MRALRFLAYELLLRGALFAVLGTAALAALYFLAIGAPASSYLEAGASFALLLAGSPDFSAAHPGYSASAIIASGAAITLPLALASLAILAIASLSGAALSSTSRYLAREYGKGAQAALTRLGEALAAILASVPLFVGFWVLGNGLGSGTPFILIAATTVLAGGLAWDAARFLAADMSRQADSTHATVFSALGPPLGRLFPLPGSFSGYLLASSMPRFLPYVAGKVPAIVGGVTVAEIIFSFPGLGSTLMDALLARNSDLLIATVFILLCLNAAVAFAVKAVLFLIYPRWYEKAI
jgi:ABC-type dipeptide/oligopeptide/nickel transport system permease component